MALSAVGSGFEIRSDQHFVHRSNCRGLSVVTPPRGQFRNDIIIWREFLNANIKDLRPNSKPFSATGYFGSARSIPIRCPLRNICARSRSGFTVLQPGTQGRWACGVDEVAEPSRIYGQSPGEVARRLSVRWRNDCSLRRGSPSGHVFDEQPAKACRS